MFAALRSFRQKFRMVQRWESQPFSYRCLAIVFETPWAVVAISTQPLPTPEQRKQHERATKAMRSSFNSAMGWQPNVKVPLYGRDH